MPTELPLQPTPDERDVLDRELMARITEDRDVAAMEDLYVRFKPRLMSFLRRLTRDEMVLEEAYNDVMVTVWRKSHQYEARSKVSSWIFSIAYRICGSPEGSEDLIAAVKRLNPKHRIVVELCYFEGYSLEEIAQIVDCPANTVKTRLYHARNKLRTLIEAARQQLTADSALAHESTLP